jgi:hypothetical protein
MADQLLIRMFDVGLGDCVYCRIPMAHTDNRDFHLLIDCGTLSTTDNLSTAVEKLKTLLPDIGGKHHVDLLVVTHEHKDHMTGFGMELWDELSFGAVWMSAAMNPEHPEAKKAKKLHSFAVSAMEQALRLNLALSPQLTELAGAMALNGDAMRTLRETIPHASGIEPVYVHAESTPDELQLPLEGATIEVLGPENDIDFYYLGKEGDESLRSAFGLIEAGLPDVAAAVPDPGKVPTPTNLDPADFRHLRSRMLSSALAFADLDGKVCNNTSVVILLTWNEKRLLFVGDAEWNRSYKEGKANCSWNVMWNLRKEKLKGQLAFLKIGHHGSENATPWGETDAVKNGEPVEILDAILPLAGKRRAQAIVSTRRGNYPTIPRADLLAEIGSRVSNTKNYEQEFDRAGVKTSAVPKFREYERDSFGEPQPMRTDLERILGGDEFEGYVEVTID